MALVIKDPQARIDYGFAWGDAYLGTQLIAQSEWSVEPAHDGGVTVVSDGHDLIETRVTLDGGRDGALYRVTNRVTMSDGQIDERSMTVRVEQR